MPDEASRRRGGDGAPFLLDVREPWEFDAPYGRHAPGAHLIPLAQLPSRLGELPENRDDELLVICKSGGRSAQAAAYLIHQGYRRVFNVATGIDGWVNSGLPTES
jgi:rhodanese-related sulfurtransferase